MVFELSEVSSKEDFKSIAHMLYAAFHEPFNPFYELLNNTQGTYDEQIETKITRHANAWAGNLAQHWLRVTDPSKDNEVIAAASWLVYKEAPKIATGNVDAFWQPEGSVVRDFTSKWLDAIRNSQKFALNKPHLVIDQLATNPKYRGQGAAGMLLKWGLEKADSLGLEIFVNAVPAGLTFYKKFGFVDKEIVNPNMTIEHPSEEWLRLQNIDKRLHWLSRPPQKDQCKQNDQR